MAGVATVVICRALSNDSCPASNASAILGSTIIAWPAQQLSPGVHVEAGLDGQPVLEGPDSARAPAPNHVELGACLGHARQRGMGQRRELANLIVERFCEVLVFAARRRVVHVPIVPNICSLQCDLHGTF